MAVKTTTIKPRKRGQKPIKFRKGGLHRTTHTPMGQKIPAWKIQKAKAGGYGPLGKKQAGLAGGPLKKGRQTVAMHRKQNRPNIHKMMSSADLYMMAEQRIAKKRRRGR